MFVSLAGVAVGLTYLEYVHCFVESYGWFESQKAVFIAMEYHEHGDLQQYMTNTFSEEEARNISLQLAEGLRFMHANRFAHRDLKPAVGQPCSIIC